MAKIYKSLNKDKFGLPTEFLVLLFLVLLVFIGFMRTFSAVIFAVVFFTGVVIFSKMAIRKDRKQVNATLSNNQYKDYYQ